MHFEPSTAPIARNGASHLSGHADDRRPRTKLAAHPVRAANALELKYQETLGEIKKLETAEYEWIGRAGFDGAEKWWRDRLKQLHSTLASLERSIRLFDPKWQRKSLMIPMVRRNARPLLPKGAFQRALIYVLRNATGPLRANEIAMRIASQLGLSTRFSEQRLRIIKMAHGSLRSNQSKGRVECVGSPAKWFIAFSTNQAEGTLALL